MSQNNKTVESMNLHEKLLKIADLAGALQKNKSGYNYKYVTEDEIQAKITGGMKKYNVTLIPSVVEGSLKVTPISYEKFDKKQNKVVTVNEVIVACEVTYTWTNADKPEEQIQCNWAYVGQMEDASQAFGAGATYGNRYYLMKALQLATVEDDPDNYRSKQKEAEDFEENQRKKEEKEKLKAAIAEVTTLGSELMSEKYGKNKTEIQTIVAEFNNGNGNPNSIESIEVAEKIKNKFLELKKEK